ncbi:cysteate racemase [Pseudoneobacillus sp. C159]
MLIQDKVVGLLGGMGPEATIDIFQRIVRATNAKKDGDHLRIMVDNNPKIPSRQDAILKGTEDPGPMLAVTAQNLEKAGADMIIICANTAHHYYDVIQDAVSIKVLHIIEETAIEMKQTQPTIKKVGVLATSGAMKVNVFQRSFGKYGLAVVEIPESLQDDIQDAIFSFKYNTSTDMVEKLLNAIDYLIHSGAEAIIMGCTEIPLILGEQNLSIPIFDPNEIIANVAVRLAKNV